MLTFAKWLLILATVGAVAWGDWRGYATYEREEARGHAEMQARFEACAAPIRAANPDEDRRLRLMTMECSSKLDDDRWMHIVAPNLRRDTVAAAAPPLVMAAVLAVLAIFTPTGAKTRRRDRKAQPVG